MKEISSSTRSITVCRRRAPMFSTLELTATAMSAMRVDGVVGEVERHAFGRHQRHVLLDQAGLGLGQDAAEIVARERAAARRGSAGGPAARAAGRTASRRGRRPRR